MKFYVPILLCISIATADPISLPDGSVYEGQLEGGLLQGDGTLTWPDGATYVGQFDTGMMQGQGQYTYPDGSIYVGEFLRGMPHGQGELTDSYNNQYRGQFEKNALVEGEMIDAQGNTYQGTFRQYRLHGQGTLTLADGSIWRGDFDNGVLTGAATFEGVNGEAYEGDVVNGQYQGYGELTRNDGAQYAGEFESGYFQGQGKLVQNGQTYEGGFEFGSFNGSGELTSEDFTYSGEFESGYFNGQGKLSKENGDVISGEFQWGEPTGNVVVEFVSGDRYEGEYYRDKFHGRGTFYDSVTGESKAGVWRQGELVMTETDSGLALTSSVESALNEQPDRLNNELQAIPEGDPDVIELFFVGIAGDGSQRVFEREVLSAEKLLNERFALNKRSVLLINSFESSDNFPLATVNSIEQTLSSIASKMNPKQDILFVYMTSHGSPEHDFYLNHAGMTLVDMPSDYLSSVIHKLPVQHKVIGISACYSGGFIPALKDDHHLVFTSAHKKNTSFGCSDDNDFTYFGRALFQEAFTQTHSFRHAFHLAYEQVTQWEKEEDFEPSKPQVSAPESIVNYLDAWIASLDKIDEPISDTVSTRWWLRETMQGVGQ